MWMQIKVCVGGELIFVVFFPSDQKEMATGGED